MSYKSAEELCLMALKIDAQIGKKTYLCFQNRICQIFVHRLKNSDFILESKMTELNQNKNSKQPDRPDAVWKIYSTLEITEKHN